MAISFDGVGFAGISEAPEVRFATGGEAEVQLDWGIRVFAATHDFISRLSDTPSNQSFLGTLEKAFRIDRSIVGAERIGEAITFGFGEVTISNFEHDYDFLADDATPLGQSISIKYGDRRRPYAEWRTILQGFMTNMQIGRDAVTFSVRDTGHNLDVPASPNVYLGTGGTEGGDDLKDKRKPRWFGWCYEVAPPCVIPSALAYQLNDGPIDSVSKVRVRGVEQVFHADYASVALMNAASIPAGKFGTCLAAGWIRIAVASGTEIGQLTCDFKGDKAGGVFVQTTADVVRRILTTATAYVDPDDLVTTSFTVLNTQQPAAIGYGIPVGDEQTAASAIGRIMAGIGGWGGPRRHGKFEVRRFSAPSGTPCAIYNRTNIDDIKLDVLPSSISPPPYRVRVGYNRIFTPGQTDLAGSVTDAYRAYLAQEVRFASAEDLSIRDDFPPGHELLEDQTYFALEADALTEAERKLALYGEPRNLYIIKLADKLFVHELGDVISVQYDNRFDLNTAKLLRVVKTTEDDAEGVTLTAFG
jgi:hypothetical protein